MTAIRYSCHFQYLQFCELGLDPWRDLPISRLDISIIILEKPPVRDDTHIAAKILGADSMPKTSLVIRHSTYINIQIKDLFHVTMLGTTSFLPPVTTG